MKLLQNFYIRLTDAAEEAYMMFPAGSMKASFCSYIAIEARKKANQYNENTQRNPDQIL